MPHHPGVRIAVVLLAAACLLLGTVPCVVASGPTVRPLGGALWYGSMVLDAQGIPHLAWVSSGTMMTATLDRATGTLTNLQPVAGSGSEFSSLASPALVSAGPRLAVVWTQDRPSGPFAGLVAAVSEDGGAHFTGPIPVPAGVPVGLAAAGDDRGDLYVAWYDMSGGTGPYPYTVRFAVLPAGDSAFRDAITLTAFHADTPVIAAEGDRVSVAWVSGYQGVDTVQVRTSVDRGATFGPMVNATTDTDPKFYPGIAAGGGYLYVTWQYIRNLQFAVAVSADGGTTFSPSEFWPYPLEGFSYGPDGSFYGILDVPGAYARVLPGQVNGTRIETGSTGFASTYPYTIAGYALSVDADGHFFYLVTQEHVLEMTGSSFEAEYATYLVTDLALAGTPFPVLAVGGAAVVGVGGAAALSFVARTRGARWRPRHAAALLRTMGLVSLEAGPGAPRWPVLAFAVSLAGSLLVLVFDVFYFVLLQGSMGPYGPTGAWLTVLWGCAGILAVGASLTFAILPRLHRAEGGALVAGSVLALVLLPLGMSWVAAISIVGGALGILWSAPPPTGSVRGPRCPSCGAPVLPGATFCGVCGARRAL